jgi:hypothetical protein
MCLHFACCVERDSPRDQLIVTIFILIIALLLLTAAIRARMDAAIAERGAGGRPTDLRSWTEVLLPANMLKGGSSAGRVGWFRRSTEGQGTGGVGRGYNPLG